VYPRGVGFRAVSVVFAFQASVLSAVAITGDTLGETITEVKRCVDSRCFGCSCFPRVGVIRAVWIRAVPVVPASPA
jgi:hypothetical protein